MSAACAVSADLRLQLRRDAAQRLRGDRARRGRDQHLGFVEEDRAVELARLDLRDRIVARVDLDEREGRGILRVERLLEGGDPLGRTADADRQVLRLGGRGRPHERHDQQGDHDCADQSVERGDATTWCGR